MVKGRAVMAESMRTYPEGERFPGVIGRTWKDSVPAFPMPPAAPAGAPNVGRPALMVSNNAADPINDFLRRHQLQDLVDGVIGRAPALVSVDAVRVRRRCLSRSAEDLRKLLHRTNPEPPSADLESVMRLQRRWTLRSGSGLSCGLGQRRLTAFAQAHGQPFRQVERADGCPRTTEGRPRKHVSVRAFHGFKSHRHRT